MKRALCILLLPLNLAAQDLDWNTVSYTAGSLSSNFGSIGNPAAFVSMNITGSTNRIDAGFPVKYMANPPGTGNDCAVNCALRSSVTFVALNESVIYTFTFNSAVTTLSFSLYDIDGSSSSGDEATVTASGPSGAATITMTNLNTPQSTISGNGTTSCTVTGTQGNTTDHVTTVSISGSVNTLVITYRDNPANPSAGNRSFSIGNMNWSGVLPVKWVSFTGDRSNNISSLIWEVTEERNVERYEVQRSFDNRNFYTIGSVSFITTSNQVNKYTYTDQLHSSSNLFYRIVQFDLDGNLSFSPVLLLRAKLQSRSFVYPNPATNVIKFHIPNLQIDQVDIYDLSGARILLKRPLQNEVNVSSLTAGFYYVEVKMKNGQILNSSFFKL